jgi:NitT/TauT family transport system substrate-binding protein
MTYNELAQVLETKNPATGKLYKLSDLNVLKMEAQGTGMLEDGVFVNSDWIGNAKNQDIAKRFLAATFQGWAYCRDNRAACVDIVLQNGPTLGKGHQTWQMNEINAITWPNPQGIGVMSAAAFNRTAAIAKKYKVIKKLPSGAYRTDLAKAAVAMDKAKGVNVYGAGYKKSVVVVTPGGK